MPQLDAKRNVVAWDVVAAPSDPNTYPFVFRAAPWRLLVRDLFFLLRNAPLLPAIFFPLTGGKDIGVVGIVAQIILLATSIPVSSGILSGAVFGIPPFVIALLVLLLVIKVGNWFQGRRLRHSSPPSTSSKEAWFFVNGICTTGTGAQAAVDRLEQLFHRPVTAILNRSAGLWFDLLECIIQRDLLYITSDIREGYNPIRRAVLNPNNERVVLIAHSQGGIIASAWINSLLCDIPKDQLAKVEVYTFASAANHFSCPTSADGAHAFAYVEHFANELDFVSQFGVLGNAPGPYQVDQWDKHHPRGMCAAREDGVVEMKKLDVVHGLPRVFGDFAGRIFCRRGHSGHLLLSHYLHAQNCILDDPQVRQFSRLTKYLDGGEAL